MIEGYKWTNSDSRSWHDGQFGPWEVGAELSVKGAKKGDPCARGIHIGKTAAHAISYGKFPGRLYRVASDGPVLGEDDTKWRVAKVRVLAEEVKPEWVSHTEAFIESIKTVQFFKPRQRQLKKWKHFEGKTRGAAWAAAWAAARDAAWATAEAAAWAAARDAAGDAARAAAGAAARATAGDAARDAAGAAAGDAARDAAGAAARAAAWDAALMAQMEITSDLDFPNAEKHRQHVRARWRVWQMGYGLVCDVDGVLYTYGVKL